MAVVHTKGARIITGITGITPSMAEPGVAGGRLKMWSETAEVAASDATSTVHLARLPSNARLSGLSKIYFDDLAASGSPTFDIGLFPVRSGDFTADDDALNDGIDVAAAAGSAAVIKDVADYGKSLWEFVSGLTEDPKTLMDVKITVKDAATNTAGTVTAEFFYTVD